MYIRQLSGTVLINLPEQKEEITLHNYSSHQLKRVLDQALFTKKIFNQKASI